MYCCKSMAMVPKLTSVVPHGAWYLEVSGNYTIILSSEHLMQLYLWTLSFKRRFKTQGRLMGFLCSENLMHGALPTEPSLPSMVFRIVSGTRCQATWTASISHHPRVFAARPHGTPPPGLGTFELWKWSISPVVKCPCTSESHRLNRALLCPQA